MISELQNKDFSCYRNSFELRQDNFDFIKIKLIILELIIQHYF